MPAQRESTGGAVTEAARRAQKTAGRLAGLTGAERNRALMAMASALDKQAPEILAANARDLEAAEPLLAAGDMSDALYRRLEMSKSKLQGLVSGIERVAALDDPVGQVTFAMELDRGLRLYRVNCPIGVVGVIFESRPDALPQIVALTMKSGNAVLLKGGSEAQHSNRALASALSAALESAGIPAGAMTLLETREDVAELLGAHEFVDLIIPRGSNAFVRHIQANTIIPVLGHADGLCHVYVDESADLQKAQRIVIDAKVDYPAACNAAETLLVHRAVAAEFIPCIVEALQQHGVEVRGDDQTRHLMHDSSILPAADADWETEYGDLILSVKIVESVDEAISHVNTYGSRHTETIVTESPSVFNRYFAEVDAAGVFLNASTRFADGFRYGFGAEVGISTGKLHPRGPVGIEGLVTYKYKLIGNGHTVAEYSGPDAKPFLHERLDVKGSEAHTPHDDHGSFGLHAPRD
jgi:glutamate-5-semialdehyde dehydrogenase